MNILKNDKTNKMVASMLRHMPDVKNKTFLEIVLLFNPFVPNAPFLYPLKTSQNRKIFWCFQEVEKGCIGNKWVKWTPWKKSEH